MITPDLPKLTSGIGMYITDLQPPIGSVRAHVVDRTDNECDQRQDLQVRARLRKPQRTSQLAVAAVETLETSDGETASTGSTGDAEN